MNNQMAAWTVLCLIIIAIIVISIPNLINACADFVRACLERVEENALRKYGAYLQTKMHWYNDSPAALLFLATQIEALKTRGKFNPEIDHKEYFRRMEELRERVGKGKPPLIMI